VDCFFILQISKLNVNFDFIIGREQFKSMVLNNITKSTHIKTFIGPNVNMLTNDLDNYIGYVVLQNQGKVISCDQKILKLIGYTINDLENISVFDLNKSMSKYKKEWPKIVDKVRKKIAVYDRQLIIRNKKKEILYFDLIAIYCHCHFKETTNNIINCEKIPVNKCRYHILIKPQTNRIKYLFKSMDNIYQALADNGRRAVLMQNEKGIIVYANKIFCKNLGYTIEDCIGKNINIFFDKSSFNNTMNNFQENQLDKKRTFNNKKCINKFGENILVNVCFIPINIRGMYMGDFIVLEDINDNIKDEVLNISLKYMIDELEFEKKNVREIFIKNLENFIIPKIKNLIRKGVDKEYIDLLINNIYQFILPNKEPCQKFNNILSPREIEMCNMIKQGLSGKEIANILNISFDTVRTHRNKIRKKLGITNKDVNLTIFLKEQY
jgi:PAS domain S-box-containing protein